VMPPADSGGILTVDAEVTVVSRRCWFHLDTVDAGARRPNPGPFKNPLDVPLIPLEERFN